MKWLDTAVAWLLVLLGGAHFLAQFVPALGGLRAPWTASTTVAIVTMGLMNAVRSRRRNDHYLRMTTAAVTVLTGGLCFAILYRFSGNVLHQPAALAVLALTVVELIFALSK
jgi:VIT1/CCC1 family predicted Fe2+/Mn2+ transporter